MSDATFIFDIETFQKDLNEEQEKLLNHKVRRVPEEKKEEEKLGHRFRLPVYSTCISISTLYDTGNGVPVKGQFFDRVNEKQLISQFIGYVAQWKGDFAHYNGIDFDVPYILFKCAQYGIEPPQRFCNLMRFRTSPHYDIMQVLSNWGKFPISLAEAALTFGIHNSKDELGGLDTISFLLQATDEQIIKYNSEDVDTTYELFKKVHKIYH